MSPGAPRTHLTAGAGSRFYTVERVEPRGDQKQKGRQKGKPAGQTSNDGQTGPPRNPLWEPLFSFPELSGPLRASSLINCDVGA